MFLKRHFSCFSHLTYVFQFFSFFLRDALPFPLLHSLSLSPRTCVPSSPARSQLSSIGFSPFRLLLIALAATPLTGVSGRADSLLRPLTSRQRQPCVRTFFFSVRRIFATMRVDFFLIRTRARVHPSCIKVSFQSSGFFYHDNVLGFFRVYLFTVFFSPCFIVASSLTYFCTVSVCTLYKFSYYFTCHLAYFPSDTFSLPSPLPPFLTCSTPCFRTFDIEYLLFLEVFHPSITSVLKSASTSSMRPTSCFI